MPKDSEFFPSDDPAAPKPEETVKHFKKFQAEDGLNRNALSPAQQRKLAEAERLAADKDEASKK